MLTPVDPNVVEVPVLAPLPVTVASVDVLFNVTDPEVPPPDKSVPAITAVISPVLFVKGKSLTNPLLTICVPLASAYIIWDPVGIVVPSLFCVP